MEIIILGHIKTNENDFVKAILQQLGHKAEIVSISADEFIDEQSFRISGEPVVVMPVNYDQIIFPETIIVEPIPITHGPIKKRGKGKIKKR